MAIIRKPARFNGQFISRHFYPEHFSDGYLHHINMGQCYDWAYFAYRLFPGIELWTTDYHAWVRVPDLTKTGYRWYDSETRRGVIDFMQLKCNARNAHPVPWESQEPTHMSPEDFKSFWDRNGGGRRYHWESHLEARLLQVCGSKWYTKDKPIFG